MGERAKAQSSGLCRCCRTDIAPEWWWAVVYICCVGPKRLLEWERERAIERGCTGEGSSCGGEESTQLPGKRYTNAPTEGSRRFVYAVVGFSWRSNFSPMKCGFRLRFCSVCWCNVSCRCSGRATPNEWPSTKCALFRPGRSPGVGRFGGKWGSIYWCTPTVGVAFVRAWVEMTGGRFWSKHTTASDSDERASRFWALPSFFLVGCVAFILSTLGACWYWFRGKGGRHVGRRTGARSQQDALLFVPSWAVAVLYT